MQNKHSLLGDVIADARRTADEHGIEYKLTQESGAGEIILYPVFEGVELAFSKLHTYEIFTGSHSEGNVMEFNFCLDGRMEYETDKGQYCYLGKGDSSLLTLNNHCVSATCPLGYFQAITLYIYLDILAEKPLPLLGDDDLFTIDFLKEKYGCCQNVIISGDYGIQKVCTDIHLAPQTEGMAYYRIKVLELLHYLYHRPFDARQENRKISRFSTEQVQLAQQVKEHIDGLAGAKYSIEELTKKFNMNRTALQRLFRGVYGTPIGSYMKKCRLNRAATLLVESDESIGEVAAMVGYENQSKFASAFRTLYEISPMDYRRAGKREN